MQKDVNLVDLIKSFPTNILLQNLASIQKRTSPVQFAHLAEKSEKGSISNLSTKSATPDRPPWAPAAAPARSAAANTHAPDGEAGPASGVATCAAAKGSGKN